MIFWHVVSEVESDLLAVDRHIGNLNRYKRKRHGINSILKIIVNGASMIFRLVSQSTGKQIPCYYQ
jgi:hypothetical protein